ncbi:transglutaminase family protein [Sphingosinicella sp. CPCC 101087]|uniref:transglutaminase family protein n=1 Tax=Sphingosinicella sp. CPCC 101087 TaxID=2497754 RepID=UPI00101C393B|nr:transglutaminase family protein [Sphingosinicella sp. CPCC 101087]
MRLSVHYTTAYHYSEPPRRIIQLLRMVPATFAGQTVLDWRVNVDCDARLRKARDGYGNATHMLYVDRPVESLAISVEGSVLTDDKAGLVQGLPHDLPPPVFLRSTPLTKAGPAVERIAEATVQSAAGTLDRLHALAANLHRDIRFDTEVTSIDTSAEQACAAGHGVCQDFAHIFIAVARRLGIPSRYVSGHLFRRDGRHVQEAGHAWGEAWVDDLGWTAFDPLNGICTDDAYVRVACGLDYRDAAPVAGARSGGGDEELRVEVRVSEAARQAQAQSQS